MFKLQSTMAKPKVSIFEHPAEAPCCSLRPLVRAHFFRRTPQWKSGVYVHSHTGRAVSCIWRRGLFLLTFCALNDTLHDTHTSHMSNASVHTLHMPKPNVTRVQSATEWTASVHTLHMPKPNVTRVQSATEWTASVHTLHMPKPNVTRLQSATEWTASVHTLHRPKPNVTRVQSATEGTASVHIRYTCPNLM